MFKKSIALLVFALATLSSCSQSEYDETDSGLKYKFVTEGSGTEPQDGSVILMNISYVDNNNKVLFSTDMGDQEPLALSYVDSMFARNGGIEEGIRMIKEGDSLVLKFPIEDLFENTFNIPLPDSLDRGTDVTVCMGATEILTSEQYKAYRMEKAYAAETEQFETDKTIIEEYLAANGIEADTHESGLRYKITSQGSGDNAISGQTVFVNYTGRLMDGQIFDTSIETIAKDEGVYNEARSYEPISFTLGTGGVIRGWDIGISLLNVGAKATFFIPSKLAYGPRQMGPQIPANSVLMFDVELVRIGE